MHVSCIYCPLTIVFVFADASNFSSIDFVGSNGPVWLIDVRCSGSESSLLQCAYDSRTTSCIHTEGVGVRCEPCELMYMCVKSYRIRSTSQIKAVDKWVLGVLKHPQIFAFVAIGLNMK